MTHTTRSRKSSPRRWAIYLRISKDDEQLGEGVARQERLCRDLHEQRQLGGEIVDTYTDNDTSAWRKGVVRPEYNRLLDDMRSGRVTGVLCYKTDRLYRRTTDLETLIEIVGSDDPPRVAIEGVRSGPVDLSTADGRKLARLLGAIAAGESDTTSERLRDTLADEAAKGRPVSGRRPFGYCADRVTPHETEAPIVVELIDRVAAGEALCSIAADFTGRGIVSSTGATFTTTTLRQLALNPRYVGRRMHNRVDVGAAVWPALVDEGTFRRVRVILTDPARRHKRARRSYLLGGLLRCDVCKGVVKAHPTYGRDGELIPRYRCQGKHPGVVSVRAEPVERMISRLVIKVVESPEYARQVSAVAGDRGADAAATVDAIRAELDDLAAAKERGELSVAELVRYRNAAQERLTAAMQALGEYTSSSAVSAYVGQTGRLAEAWPKLSVQQQRAIVECVIDHIDVLPVDRGTGGVFDEDRIVAHRV